MHRKLFNKKTDSLIRALQTTYWLAKENVASSKYGSLLDFLDFQGVDVASMAVGGNASYQSRTTVEEFQVRWISDNNQRLELVRHFCFKWEFCSKKSSFLYTPLFFNPPTHRDMSVLGLVWSELM